MLPDESVKRVVESRHADAMPTASSTRRPGSSLRSPISVALRERVVGVGWGQSAVSREVVGAGVVGG